MITLQDLLHLEDRPLDPLDLIDRVIWLFPRQVTEYEWEAVQKLVHAGEYLRRSLSSDRSHSVPLQGEPDL